MSAGILAQLKALSKLDQKDFLAEYVKGEFKQALYIDPLDPISINVSIFDLGLNSLGAVTLKQRFETALACKIDTTDFFANPTIGHFIENLSDRLFGIESITNTQKQDTSMHNMVNDMLRTLYGTDTTSQG